MLLMFGFALIISFWISIAGRSPTCLLMLQSADKRRPLCRDFWRRDWCQVDFCQFFSAFGETSESMVDCMSDVTEKPPLFMSRIPVKKQSSLVWVISKMSSWVGLWSVSSFSLRVSRSLVVFVPPWGGGGLAGGFSCKALIERVREKEQFKAL